MFQPCSQIHAEPQRVQDPVHWHGTQFLRLGVGMFILRFQKIWLWVNITQQNCSTWLHQMQTLRNMKCLPSFWHDFCLSVSVWNMIKSGCIFLALILHWFSSEENLDFYLHKEKTIPRLNNRLVIKFVDNWREYPLSVCSTDHFLDPPQRFECHVQCTESWVHQ